MRAIKLMVVLLVVLALQNNPPKQVLAEELNKQTVQATETQAESAAEPPQPQPAAVVQEVTPEPPKPTYSCGRQSPQVVYALLREAGLNRTAAIEQLGSWKQESGLDPCQKRGDNGKAWGLNSWHPGRRRDMPFDLAQQVHWAIHVEMPRDCRPCYEQLLHAQDPYTARQAIKRSTRWGHLGSRWVYADQFAKMF